jgi:hypothetical protein
MLLYRHRIVGAAFDGRVVTHDHAFATRDACHAGYQARAGCVVGVHVVRCEQSQFQKRRPRVNETRNALARQQLAPGDVAFLRTLPPACHRCIGSSAHNLDRLFHGLGVG